MTTPTNRMTLSQVVERLTERKGSSSSVTVKLSAQGVVMPEVTVAAGTPDEDIDKMIRQAIDAFVKVLAEAQGENGGGK